MLRVRQRAREHRGDGAVDGREHLAAAQHARGAALRDEYAVRRQLALDDVAVKLLGVQLEGGGGGAPPAKSGALQDLQLW